jgi:hypothetical protein
MADDESGLNWIFAANDMQVRAANRRKRDANDGFAGSGVRSRNFFYSNVIHTAENGRSHCVHFAPFVASSTR